MTLREIEDMLEAYFGHSYVKRSEGDLFLGIIAVNRTPAGGLRTAGGESRKIINISDLARQLQERMNGR